MRKKSRSRLTKFFLVGIIVAGFIFVGTSITTANWKDTFPDAAKVYDIQMIKNNAPIHATMTVEVQHE